MWSCKLELETCGWRTRKKNKKHKKNQHFGCVRNCVKSYYFYYYFIFKTHSWHSFSILSFFSFNSLEQKPQQQQQTKKNRKFLLRREGWGNDWDFWLHSLMLVFLYKLAFDRSCFFVVVDAVDEFNEFNEKRFTKMSYC